MGRWQMNTVMAEWYWQGKPKNSEKACPPQIPQGLIRDRNRTLALRSQLLTTCAMASSIRDSYQGLFKKLQLFPTDDRHCQKVIKLLTTNYATVLLSHEDGSKTNFRNVVVRWNPRKQFYTKCWTIAMVLKLFTIVTQISWLVKLVTLPPPIKSKWKKKS
jgi:hypothetical protein